MEIKNWLVVGILIWVNVVSAQFEERQLKFACPESFNSQTVYSNLDGLNGYSFEEHEAFRYFDIYLDTPDDLLLKSGFSLRMRKRLKSDSIPTYVMQLKNESTDTSSLRIEIEEKELDFYRLFDGNGDTVFVTEILDQLFASMESKTSSEDYEELLETWIAQSVSASISPFYYLKYHQPGVFTSDVLATLDLKLIGVSHRRRGYIFTNKERHPNLNQIVRSNDDTPEFFQQNPNFIWLMETSLDSAIFYSRFGSNPITIREFEVELKYQEIPLGEEIMKEYTQALQTALGLEAIRDSKYLQVRKSLWR